MNQKLDVARVFERIFEIYRSQFTLLMPAALVLFIPVAVVNGLVAVGDVTLLGILIVLVASTVASFWFQGMVVEAARDILDGRRDYTLGSLLSSVTPVLGALVVAGILAGLGIGIGLILLIVPGLFLLTIWAVIAPVIVVERMGAIDAFRRSRALVKGHGWQVFGVIVVLFIVQFLLSSVIQAVADSVADSFAGYAIADLLVHILIAPLTALAAAVLFFELKALRGEPVLAVGEGGQVAAPAPPAAPDVPEAPAPPPPPPPPTGS
jgi:hypothetical protein